MLSNRIIGGYKVEKVNLKEKMNLIKKHWSPKIAGELNDSHIKLAKIKGEFIWHHHDHEDELFFVVKGKLVIRLKNQDIHLEEGEFLIIPKGVEHLPVAEEEVEIMMIEPKTTVNTGNVNNDKTVEELDWI